MPEKPEMFPTLSKNDFRTRPRKLVHCGHCIRISRYVNELHFSNNFTIKRNKTDFHKWRVAIIRK